MVPSSTFSKSNTPGEYAPWMVTTITSGEQVPQEKLLQLIEAPSLTTGAFWTTANAPANPTIANPYIIFQYTPNYERYIISAEDTSGVSFVSFSDLSSLKWTTETHNRTRYFPCGLLFRSLGYPVVQFISEMITLPENPWMPIQVIQDAFIRDYYELVPKRTIADLARAYEARMARQPSKRYIDIDLPMMDDGGDW